MATFIRVKGLKDGDVIEKPMTMTIADEKMHLYQNCSWHGKWVQVLEEKQEDKISVKSKLVDEPKEQVKEIKMRTEPKTAVLSVEDLAGDLGGDLEGKKEPKKRGRKPKA
jgi:hypothetical protein